MSEQKQKASFHFVTFQDASNAPGRKTSEKSRARAHAARVTHLRRKAKRGQKVVKWIVEVPKSRANEAQARSKERNLTTDVQISPVSILSQDKVDPFRTNPHAILPKRLQSILELAYECIHPKILLNATESEVSMIKISWRRLGQEWPLMFQLQVGSAANLVRADVSNPALENEIEVLRMKYQARGLAGLAKLTSPPSAANIMALVMGALLTDPSQTQYFETIQPSPLATAQHLHLYARLKIIPEMIKALLEQVNKCGGIQALHEFGNSHLLQFADLMISSRTGQAPSFPWLRPSPPILGGPRYHPDGEALMMANVIGSGFDQLDPIDAELANVLKDAGDITVALDHYQRGRPNAPSLTDLVNAANETHHKLLSIKPNISAEPSPSPSSLDCLRNACRLAGLIYSDMVLFPLPPTTEVRPRLARELRLVLEKFEILQAAETAQHDYGNQDCNLLVLWVLTLGGLASLNTPNRPYFLQKLQEYIGRTPYVTDCNVFSNFMAMYLWWDYIFDEPARRLWADAALLPSPLSDARDELYVPNQSFYLRQSPWISVPLVCRRRDTTDSGTYGLPTPDSSEYSPPPPAIIQRTPP